MTAIVVLDRALCDVDALVAECAAYLARRLGGTPPLDPAALPAEAGAAIAAIDVWAGAAAANWRAELVRWFEAHAPVRLTPDPDVSGRLRAAARGGTRLALASALPREAAALVAAHLPLRRQLAIICGEEDGDAIAAARAALDAPAATVAADRAALLAALA